MIALLYLPSAVMCLLRLLQFGFTICAQGIHAKGICILLLSFWSFLCLFTCSFSCLFVCWYFRHVRGIYDKTLVICTVCDYISVKRYQHAFIHRPQ